MKLIIFILIAFLVISIFADKVSPFNFWDENNIQWSADSTIHINKQYEYASWIGIRDSVFPSGDPIDSFYVYYMIFRNNWTEDSLYVQIGVLSNPVKPKYIETR